MIRLTLRNLRTRFGRVLATFIAVVVGTSFLTGTFVLTDGLTSRYEDLVEEANEGIDLEVRGSAVLDTALGERRSPMPAAVTDQIAAHPDVDTVAPRVRGYAQPVGPDGVVEPGAGGASLGSSWIADADLNPFDLSSGRAPEGPDQVVLDRGTVEELGVGLGDDVTILTQQAPRPFTLVGITTFAGEDRVAGSTVAFFDQRTATQLLGREGEISSVQVRLAEGVSATDAQQTLGDALGPDYEVMTGAEVVDEMNDTISDGISAFTAFLLTFALITVVVGAFIIQNTAAIVLTQRTRELALLKAVGGRRRQVLGVTLAESALVGLAGTATGVTLGLAVAAGLRALLGGVGLEIPSGPPVLLPRTILIAVVVGLGVSVMSAMPAAMRVARIAPVAVLRDASTPPARISWRRKGLAVLTLAGGLLSITSGLDADAPGTVAGGAVLMIAGVLMLGPAIALLAGKVMGWPLERIDPVIGRLAHSNIERNPRRAASSAGALMLGVALVVAVTVFASSTKASVDVTVGENVAADLVVSAPPAAGLPPTLAEGISQLPEVEAALPTSFGPIGADGDELIASAADLARLPQFLDLDITDGALGSDVSQSMAVHVEEAERLGWAVGDTIEVTFADGESEPVEVAALYDLDLAGVIWMDRALFATHASQQLDSDIFLRVTGDDPTAAQQAIAPLLDPLPTAELETRDEYAQSATEQVDQLVGLVYALLGVAVLIAVLGIANTLALAVVERTRELGLLRAVGMTRRQLRHTIRNEAFVVALQGTVVGLGLGVLFGWAIVRSMADDGVSELAVPGPQLVVIAVVGAITGVLASVLPARRAARLSIPSAVTS